jgi:hypothetical protein
MERSEETLLVGFFSDKRRMGHNMIQNNGRGVHVCAFQRDIPLAVLKSAGARAEGNGLN